MTEEQKSKCKDIFLHYGIASQRRQLIEECAELIQAVTKFERVRETGKAAAFERVNFIEELADVMIMCEQFAGSFFRDKPLSVMIDRKLDRQLQRMRGKKMREIFFRGKREDNGEWVEGDFGRYYDGRKDVDCISFSSNTMTGSRCYSVDANTVGQYTGLTDKNGNKIFEGDILSIAQKSDSVGEYFDPPIKYPANVIVKWDLCAWMWEVILQEKYYLTFPDAWCHYECEIIGNIYDNPELVGGDKA